MAMDRLSGKLAVILHADVAGSTQLVRQDEQLAHERIQDAFRRFSEVIGKSAAEQVSADLALPLPHRASIAVLPFDNMIDDPNQEYFSDGIAE